MKGSQSPSNAQNVGDPPQTTRIYLPGLPEWVHVALEEAGYDAETLREASAADLEAVDGIGKATARKIRKAFEEWAEA
jgi:DNA integrity scanning protein DisA with diadenylate cyclase activity